MRRLVARQAIWNWDCVGFCKRVLPLCRGCMLLLLLRHVRHEAQCVASNTGCA